MSPDLRPFLRFLLGRFHGGQDLDLPAGLVEAATRDTIADVRHHYDVTAEEVARRVSSNQNELAVFLYRLGRRAYEDQPRRADLLEALHGLMRSCCACEVYFSNAIGEGFYMVHGLGTVIGSRNTIGKGFQIYQGCTIGHRQDFEDGCLIGDNVIMYTQAMILGPVRIGDDVVIGAGCQIMSDVPAGTICQAASDYRLLTRKSTSNQPLPRGGHNAKGPS
ncbi:MAG: hypothetical protein V1806_02170 [Pseudomonadota bacterium]